MLTIRLIHNLPTLRRFATDACRFCKGCSIAQVFLENGVQRFRQSSFLQRFFELQRNLKQFEAQAAIVVKIAKNLLPNGDFGFSEVGELQLFLQEFVQGADLGDFGQLGISINVACSAPFADAEPVVKGEIQVNVNRTVFLVNVLLRDIPFKGRVELFYRQGFGLLWHLSFVRVCQFKHRVLLRLLPHELCKLLPRHAKHSQRPLHLAIHHNPLLVFLLGTSLLLGIGFVKMLSEHGSALRTVWSQIGYLSASFRRGCH